MLNIVIPMAGRGSRFADAGFTDPKPLIPLGGRPMIQWVIDNIRPARAHRFIFICLAAHLETYPEVPATLRRLAPGCEIITVRTVTEGAACTVLLARNLIANDDPLMIANSDQFVEVDIDAYLAAGDATRLSGHIMTFNSDHPKWSYCRLAPDGHITEVVEKRVVSHEATVGIYNFRRGADFVAAAETMIKRDLRVNGEFYVAPAYNLMIEAGQVIVPVNIEQPGRAAMHGLGTPDDYSAFQLTEAFRRSARAAHA